MKAAKSLFPRFGKETPPDEQNTDKGNQVSKEVLPWQTEGEEYIKCNDQM